MATTRLNVTLHGSTAQKLSAMAERMHVNEGTLARSLLSTAIDEADADPANVVRLLDGIDGAWGDAQEAGGRRRTATPSPWISCSPCRASSCLDVR